MDLSKKQKNNSVIGVSQLQSSQFDPGLFTIMVTVSCVPSQQVPFHHVGRLAIQKCVCALGLASHPGLYSLLVKKCFESLTTGSKSWPIIMIPIPSIAPLWRKDALRLSNRKPFLQVPA